jgi:ATP-binding cassette subfamily C protein
MDIAGIGIIAPLISSISNPENLQSIINEYLGFFIEIDKIFIYTACLTIAIFIIKSTISILLQNKIFKFALHARSNITQRLAAKYLGQSILYHQTHNVSSVLQKMQVHTNYYIDLSLIPILRAIAELFVMIATVSFLIYLSPLIMIVAFLLLGSIIIAYNFFFKDIFYINGKKDLEESEKIIKQVKESIQSVREIKVFKKESYFLNKIKNSSIARAKAGIRVATLTIAPRHLLETSLIILIIIISYIQLQAQKNVLDALPILGIFAMASFRMIPSINAISIMLSQTGISLKSLNDIYSDLQLNDSNDLGKEDNLNCNDSSSLIEINNLEYSYDGKVVLDGVSFNISKGDFIGIVGASGSGKTTLLHLVAKLLPPSNGTIKHCNYQIINGEMINDISLVDQDPAILSDTLRNNIAFGCDLEEIDDKKVIKALSMASLKSFYSNLENGLDHYLNDSGLNISGGERQRIGIARAIYSDKSLFLLDEPSSAIDRDNSDKIRLALSELSKSKTLFVISHNIDFLNNCNKIYELKNGKLSLLTK